ncbi:putative SUA7-TFIIB subunit, factor E [Acaromyces ingoldii]|uniref:Transcription initiation factor IIB n=1 Tax=Acaromyces ingoldii TaxID=215250 RepID=A0A316YDT1_9BASI|nr:putative SUA7-TFIIB subunit, factor E [Acaromyces ingoldii]PWN87352.1 putative SUA7-TFIIB subunit, factor E [Acaromyces ingoldii]
MTAVTQQNGSALRSTPHVGVNGNGSTATKDRAQAINPYAQPFALTAHYKATRDPAAAEAEQQSKDGFVPDLGVRLVCPECRNDPPNLVEEFASGDLVCGDCGMVVGDKIIDTRSEWRTFANEEGDDPSRVGQSNSPLMDGLTDQLDTRIGFRDGGTGAARDLQRAMGRSGGSQNRVILDAFEDIQRKCDVIHLPRTVSETAKHMFKQVEQDKILRGKKTDAIIAAAIYCACKTNKVPRTFPEICQLTNVSKKLIGKCFKEMQQAYGLNINHGDGSGVDAVSPTNAVDLVGRFCNHLGLENQVTRITEEVAKAVRNEGVLAGRSPTTIAAACIYMASILAGMTLSAKKISTAAGVSDVTIKSSYRELIKSKEKILTSAILTKYGSRIDPSRLV